VPSACTAARADVASDIAAPEGFHEVGAPGEPAFREGCTNNPAFPELQSVGFYKDREGVVHLKGSYTCANGGMAFNPPPGYRPPGGEIHAQPVGCVQHGPAPDCTASLTTMLNILGGGFGTDNSGGVSAGTRYVILSGVAFRAGS
jgi:hypothetical protein